MREGRYENVLGRYVTLKSQDRTRTVAAIAAGTGIPVRTLYGYLSNPDRLIPSRTAQPLATYLVVSPMDLITWAPGDQ